MNLIISYGDKSTGVSEFCTLELFQKPKDFDKFFHFMNRLCDSLCAISSHASNEYWDYVFEWCYCDELPVFILVNSSDKPVICRDLNIFQSHRVSDNWISCLKEASIYIAFHQFIYSQLKQFYYGKRC